MLRQITTDRCGYLTVGFFIAGVLFLSLAGTGWAIQCYQCHGTASPADYRPVDAPFRNRTTGGFPGSHRTHMAPGATVTNCTPCHGGRVASYTTSHRDGFINITSNINGSPATGAYSRGTSFAQSANPTLGTCSGVNCHFESATPTWGATPLAAPTDCNKCHGAAPADGSHPATSGSGKKHGDYYGTTTGSCVKCHPDHTAEGAPFAHATSAGHRGLAVQFTAAPNSGAGSYGGTVGYPNYLPSQAPPRNGTCSGLYCHSPGNKASAFNAPNTVATWGGSLTCTGCHKATVDYMNTGSHYAHVFGGGTTYSQIKCSVCHAATASGNTAIADVTRHVDYQVEIAFANSSSAANGSYNGAVAKPATPSAKAPGSSYGSCQNVYCHSTGQADGGTWPPTYTTPTWGSATTGKCGTCHGTTGSDTHGGFPGLMIQRQISSGSHRKHLKTVYGITDSDMKCAICHAYDKSAFTSTSASCGTVCHVASQPLKHANYEINVNIANYFGATAGYNGSTRPGAGYSTCSSVYCHSNGLTASPTYTTPTWGNAASGACGTCHGVTAAAPPASTPHAKHVGSANPYRFACAECHNGKVQATANATTAPAFANSTSHVNKSRDVKFDPTNAFGTYSSAITTCRNLYCHSTGNTSVAAGNLPGAYGGSVYVRQGWTGSVTCNSCHGRSTSNGMPDYTNAGAAGSATSNSHAKHVQSSGISCGECHEKTTKNGTSIRTTVSPSYHVNGSRNVFFNLTGNNASGTYDSAQKKCSSTYCHGAGASLAWGGSTYCNSCHSANAGTTGGGGINNWGTTPVSAHKLHVEETTALPSKYSNYSTGNLSGSATAYRFGCASCHNPAQATHVSGYASSPYRAQVFFGYTAPGKKPTYTYTGAAGTTDNGFAWSNGNTACTSTYCHSNGAGGSGNTAVSWATTASSATNTRCKACHSYTTASGLLISTNKHAKHVDGTTYGFSCAKCHNATTTDGATIADKTKHVNKKKDVVWDGTNSDGSAYVNSSTACANIYCHSQGTTFAQPYTGAGKAPNTAVTWGGGQTLGCNGCHGNSNSYTTGTYRIAAPLYASGAPKGNAHQLHIDARATQGSAQPQCLNCHGKTTTTNTSIASYSRHVNEFYNISTAGTYKDGDNVTAAAGSLAAVTYTYNAAGSTCANVTCHPTGLGDANKAATVVAWNNRYNCTDCHKVDIANSTGYHHAMRNYSGSYAAYPTAVPQGDATTGTNSNSRLFTMCHVDHNIFSPMLNTNSAARANNLRTNITVAPVAGTASTYSNSDYVGTSGGSGGICISCHNSELTKSTTRILTETSSTKTVAIPFVSYSASAHEYAVASAMKGTDGGTFNANCSKCHNGRNGETAVFSQMTTTVHDRSVRRVYASLGTNLVDGNDENFCYRCHSKTADASPGGGPAKTVANKDYYKTAAMSSRAEGIFTAFQKTYKHNVAGYTGVHKPSPTNETAAYISANRHVECADCHNPHAATSANPIRGVTGLDPTTPAAGATPTYTVVTLNNPDHQYKLCFKCHTNWAGYGTGTNLAVEFNTNNVSYHWVENDKGAPKASTTYGNFNTTYVYKMMPRYNGYTNTQLRSVKMRCSDCHGSDGADGGVTVPEGPHGSSIAKILKVPAGSPYTTWNSTVKRLDGTVWCFNCHDPNFTSTGFSGEQANSHTYGSGYKHDRNCQYCHISVPHGNSTLKRLLNPSTFRTGINSINSGSYTQSNGHAQVIPGCT
ncbi:CxxxxCH/CxxCH domain-containing protein [Geobacter sp.]|uniref:CxxxxCH/CxxCH domain c-type cytochrome n=1 Tax=Geobacter sp. TaxID=46610 RepID=UPI00262DD355|nr:CxxxxCH/CxxCH domain-containing protein [Geobacter sp.]